MLDSLIAAGNSFQMVGAEKLKERLLKLVVQEGMHKRFWLAEWRQHRKQTAATWGVNTKHLNSSICQFLIYVTFVLTNKKKKNNNNKKRSDQFIIQKTRNK